jgi:phosphopantetheinyl transferase (holo-ACP synthase)
LPIGNDIIDLEQERNSGRSSVALSRYAKKVLSSKEWKKFQIEENSELYLWQAWASKEAAFKLLRQITPELRFLPRAYTLAEDLSHITHIASVSDDVTDIPITFKSDGDYLFCRAYMGAGPSRLVKVPVKDKIAMSEQAGEFPAPDTSGTHPSKRVRELCLELLRTSKILSSELGQPQFAVAASGMPLVRDGSETLPLEISFSHHGRFVAVSIAQGQIGV